MRTIRVALIQFDARPEQVAGNLARIEAIIAEAAVLGAQWVIFHEGTLGDYGPDVASVAEGVPEGASTQALIAVAAKYHCWVSFGLTETFEGRYFITQVFLGPEGFVYRYRKTWLWRNADDVGYRNEWMRFDPGTGPEIFVFDGVKATCFICADGEAPRCIARARDLAPDVVFFPNNRATLPNHDEFGGKARMIGAPMLVTNRTGQSWTHACEGGCTVYGRDGEVLAAANRTGREEILIHDLNLTSE